MLQRIIKNNKGQTAVEYLLLIAVAVGFGLTFAKKMDEFIIKNPNGMIGKPLNKFKAELTPETRYQRYNIGPVAH